MFENVFSEKWSKHLTPAPYPVQKICPPKNGVKATLKDQILNKADSIIEAGYLAVRSVAEFGQTLLRPTF